MGDRVKAGDFCPMASKPRGTLHAGRHQRNHPRAGEHLEGLVAGYTKRWNRQWKVEPIESGNPGRGDPRRKITR